MKSLVAPRLSQRRELWWARGAAAVAVVAAGATSVRPSGPVAQTVAYAFGIAASSFFPAIVRGSSEACHKEAAMAGMLAGTALAFGYFGWLTDLKGDASARWLGISPRGSERWACFSTSRSRRRSLATPAPPQHVQDLVASVRFPREPRLDARSQAAARGEAIR